MQHATMQQVLDFALEVASDPAVHRGAAMVLQPMAVLRREDFLLKERTRRGPRSVRRLYAEWSKWGCRKVCVDLFNCLNDLEKVASAGLDVAGYRSGRLLVMFGVLYELGHRRGDEAAACRGRT